MYIQNINKELLVSSLQTIIGVVDRKHTLPILSNILIRFNEHKCQLLATDLEIQISKSFQLENCNTVGATTINGKKLIEVSKVLPGQNDLSISLDNSKAVIRSAKSKFSLQTLPAEDFPLLNEQVDSPIQLKIKQQTLKSLFSSVQYAMAQQDVRYYLNGILFIAQGSTLQAVATDGHRLAYNSIDVPEQVELLERVEVIIPRKAVSELCRLLSDDDSIIDIQLSKQQIKFNFSEITLVSKVIDGKFPDFERVIPKYESFLDINKGILVSALQRVSILASEKFRGIRLILTENKLTVVSTNSEQEEAIEDLDVGYHGPSLDMGFNVSYLMEGLNWIGTNEARLSFGDSNSSALIQSTQEDDFRYVVMPMRI